MPSFVINNVSNKCLFSTSKICNEYNLMYETEKDKNENSSRKRKIGNIHS